MDKCVYHNEQRINIFCVYTNTHKHTHTYIHKYTYINTHIIFVCLSMVCVHKCSCMCIWACMWYVFDRPTLCWLLSPYLVLDRVFCYLLICVPGQLASKFLEILLFPVLRRVEIRDACSCPLFYTDSGDLSLVSHNYQQALCLLSHLPPVLVPLYSVIKQIFSYT